MCPHIDHIDRKATVNRGITPFFSIPVRLTDGSLYGTLCATSRQK